jgi:hypothetical protein
MCLHALLCVYMLLTNTRVEELEVKERTSIDLLIVLNVLTNTEVDMVEQLNLC